MMKMDTKSLLQRQRDEILAQLVDLAAAERERAAAASYRGKAEGLVTELTLTERLLSSINGSGAEQKFGAARRPIDAVVQYLKDSQVPAGLDEIVEAVVAGGFRSGAPGTHLFVQKSIKIFLNGTGARTNTIKQINGRIGLYDWEDARFA